MRDELLHYYEQELSFLRRSGAEFAEKYPKVAGRLIIEPDKCEDPHVERLLEGFAFLAARVHLKMDDQFPEITTALLNTLYPHYLRPIPSMSVVEFHADREQIKPDTGLRVPRHSILLSRPIDGVPCRFRTCYDVNIWPVSVAHADWGAAQGNEGGSRTADVIGAVRVRLRCPAGLNFGGLGCDSLRFHLAGEGAVPHILYEILGNNCVQIVVRDLSNRAAKPIVLPASAIRPAGFEASEGMLPGTRRSFIGHQLLQEYFCFPQKFLFFDLERLSDLKQAGFSHEVEFSFLISSFERGDRRNALETGVSASSFRLGCTPIVNLFEHTAEPIMLDHRRSEYQVIPDVTRRNGMEVFSVEEVLSANTETGEVVHLNPLYSSRRSEPKHTGECFWLSESRPATRRGDEGLDVFLSLADLSGRSVQPNLETLTVRTLCTNRDLPSRLPFGNESGDFQLQSATSVSRIVTLGKLTPTLRPEPAKDSLWKLISQLSLNHLSLVEEGLESLREILRLYNFSNSTSADRQISGINSLTTRRHMARVASEEGVLFTRGNRTEIELNEDHFVGGSAYLFSAVLEHFFGLYVSLNSFSQLLVRTQQRKEPLKLWPPRSGRKILI
jgi:type VI secretion system protein ImpG